MKQRFSAVNKTTRGPLWQFAGLGLFALLLTWVISNDIRTRKQEEAYIKEPMIGDLYSYEVAEKSYSLMKVVRVDADSIWVLLSNFEVNVKNATDQLDTEEQYGVSEYSFTHQDLEEMYADKYIYEIQRD